MDIRYRAMLQTEYLTIFDLIEKILEMDFHLRLLCLNNIIILSIIQFPLEISTRKVLNMAFLSKADWQHDDTV